MKKAKQPMMTCATPIAVLAITMMATLPQPTSADCILKLGPNGGNPANPFDAEMEHLRIFFDGVSISVTKQGANPEPMILADYGQDCPDPADVLNGKAYNAQYGWNITGFWGPPANTGVWIRPVTTPLDFEVYHMTTFALFGTDGSPTIWQWDGTMTHNWCAVPDYGDYEATFEVYIGDLSGNPLVQYNSDTVTVYLSFPSPFVPADTDEDGDVDGVDFSVFAACFNQAGNPPRTLGCSPEAAERLDFDDDNDVDGVDFAAFAACFNKAGNPPRTAGCPQQ